MARFAAADPQVTGVLQDIIQYLRGLERRLDALEGRPRSAPAPDEGTVVAAPASTPDAGGKKKRQRKRRKGKASEDQSIPAPKTAKSATPKSVAVPSTKPRGGGGLWPQLRQRPKRPCREIGEPRRLTLDSH